jgi:hypothetical protein
MNSHTSWLISIPESNPFPNRKYKSHIMSKSKSSVIERFLIASVLAVSLRSSLDKIGDVISFPSPSLSNGYLCISPLDFFSHIPFDTPPHKHVQRINHSPVPASEQVESVVSVNVASIIEVPFLGILGVTEQTSAWCGHV